MLSNILIATGFAGIGFIVGVWTTGYIILKRFNQFPLDVVVLMDKYADEIFRKG